MENKMQRYAAFVLFAHILIFQNGALAGPDSIEGYFDDDDSLDFACLSGPFEEPSRNPEAAASEMEKVIYLIVYFASGESGKYCPQGYADIDKSEAFRGGEVLWRSAYRADIRLEKVPPDAASSRKLSHEEEDVLGDELPSSAHAGRDAIALIYPESAVRIFFWESGSFKNFVVAD